MNTEKMICPDCGAEMNYHAEKIDYSASPDDTSVVDRDLGGVLKEAHSCPNCGKTHMRPKAKEKIVQS